MRLEVPLNGELIDTIVEQGYGFLRVGIDLVFDPTLYTELILTDREGERSPVECVVTGIKNNWDNRIQGGARSILKVRYTDVDVDELEEGVTETLDDAMNSDFAAVDTPDTPILPGSLTPSGPEAGVLKDKDEGVWTDGALFTWDRRFWSARGQAVLDV